VDVSVSLVAGDWGSPQADKIFVQSKKVVQPERRIALTDSLFCISFSLFEQTQFPVLWHRELLRNGLNF
jgi:hypothetical protein